MTRWTSTMYKQKCQLRSQDVNRVETELTITIAKIHNDHNVDKTNDLGINDTTQLTHREVKRQMHRSNLTTAATWTTT